MIVRATYTFDFEVNTEGWTAELADIPGLAKELTREEAERLLKNGLIEAECFKYETFTTPCLPYDWECP